MELVLEIIYNRYHSRVRKGHMAGSSSNDWTILFVKLVITDRAFAGGKQPYSIVW